MRRPPREADPTKDVLVYSALLVARLVYRPEASFRERLAIGIGRGRGGKWAPASSSWRSATASAAR